MEMDPDEKDMVLSNSNETISDSVTCWSSAECEFWDKYLQPFKKFQKSRIDYNFRGWLQ